MWAALALHQLTNDTSMDTVAATYGVPRGDVQSLRQSAVAFAGMVSTYFGRSTHVYPLEYLHMDPYTSVH